MTLGVAGIVFADLILKGGREDILIVPTKLRARSVNLRSQLFAQRCCSFRDARPDEVRGITTDSDVASSEERGAEQRVALLRDKMMTCGA